MSKTLEVEISVKEDSIADEEEIIVKRLRFGVVGFPLGHRATKEECEHYENLFEEFKDKVREALIIAEKEAYNVEENK